MNVSVLVADDHPVVRSGIAREIEETEGLTLVATVGDGAEALASVRQHRPDVALLDLDMPVMSGLDVIKPIKEEGLPTKVLILTGSAEEDGVFAAITAGASGYLLKTASWEEVAQAVKDVAEGRNVVAPEMMTKFVCKIQRQEVLSPGEIAVLDRIRRMTAGCVALELQISVGAVRKRLSQAYSKLGVTGKYEAIIEARLRGLIT